MAILENIRNKAGVLVSVIIGLALVSFILGDILTKGNSKLFSSSEYDVANVAGKSVPIQLYQEKLDEVFKVYQMNNRDKEMDEQTMESLREQTWNDLIETFVMEDEYKDLGIDISLEELKDMVVGSNIHPIIKQVFGDPETGQVNTAGVQNFIENLETQYKEQKPFWLYLENEIIRKKKLSKFNNLVKKAVFVTNFEAENALAEKNHEVVFDFVAKKFSDISDSLVSFTDSDISEYYKSHESDYEQEASRSVAYVTFDVVASAEDNVYAQKWINNILPEFQSVDNDIQFVNFNSDVPFDTKNYKKGELVERLDTIMFDQEVGYVYGPYFENLTYKLAKLSEINFLPDSVRASHILIKYEQNQDQYNAAKALLDSLKTLAEGGASFADLATKHSVDGSAQAGGDLGWFKEGAMVAQFSDACFKGKKGDLVIVDTQFGSHLILITDRSKDVKKVKVGIIERKVEPSTNTFQDYFAKASKFAGSNRSEESFNAAITEQNLNKRVATLRENDKQIGGLDNPRQLIKWSFQNEKGAVSDVFEFGSRYVVAVVTDVKEKGKASLDQVRNEVETVLIKEKKGDYFSNKFNEAIKNGKDLSGIASEFGLEVENSGNISFATFQIAGHGMEHKVIASAVKLKKDELSKAVTGDNGIYVLKVTAVSDKENKDIQPEKTRLANSIMQRVDYEVYNALKENSNISDNRSKFY